ncbi:MAG: hypothetical protein HUK06_01245 [Bacteroidaceae bacterium]|nr:hypothetical protein [Bacteroidaceae bacterium]
MKRKCFIVAIALLAMCSAVRGQTEKKKFEFKPIATGMMSVGANFPADSKVGYGFNLDRAYLGVEGKWGKGWSFKFVADCGKSSAVDDYQRIVYIKNALVQWKSDRFSVRAGLIGTNVFGTQEKFWGRRYVMKTFQDEYKFGSSADLGAAIEWSPSRVVSLDAIIVNGEGFKKLQIERGLLYGVGITVKPVEGLTLRAYGDLNQKPDDSTPKKTLNAMVGYKNQTFSIAVEGSFIFDKETQTLTETQTQTLTQTETETLTQTQTQAQSQSQILNRNQSGLSAYGSVKVGKCDIFARYDLLTSKNNWNKSKDGSMALAGVGIDLCKYVKMAPNVKVWIPKEGKATPSVNVNFQFAL